jgi:hypothetical protein
MGRNQTYRRRQKKTSSEERRRPKAPPGGGARKDLDSGGSAGKSEEGNGSFHVFRVSEMVKRVSESVPTQKIRHLR